ncbi:splicing factor 3A subunit 2-like [Dendronephthya gigantea]|uniref:splicing factor 3A subunit 2-like n=1 Tax=Dendronephthya gigantea TaxID=151771 RepID=UPI0010694FFB|nr:splicing factor 3A subunit 2-like [Dendronephthya gigantea]
MDFQNRAGGKTGSGGVASFSESNRDRRERLRQLALETIDLNKDPYFMKNHLGSYECKLCLTLHNNEGSYLAHTQGKKHQQNLARRAAKEAKEAPAQPQPEKPRVSLKKFVKIGRPGYKVTKQREQGSGQHSLLFQIDYPEIAEGLTPRHRFMSAYEQRIEPPDRSWQYLLFAAEPYETVAFKIPSREIDKSDGKFWTHWNPNTKQFFFQMHFKISAHQQQLMQQMKQQQSRNPRRPNPAPGAPPPPPGVTNNPQGPSGPPPPPGFNPPPPSGPPSGPPPGHGPPSGPPPGHGPPSGPPPGHGPPSGPPPGHGPPSGPPPGHGPPSGPPGPPSLIPPHLCKKYDDEDL